MITFPFLLAASWATAMGQPPSPFMVSSTDVADGATIDKKFIYKGNDCDGQNFSPQLTWSRAPEGTKSFAIIILDPDAKAKGGWWHWLVFNIPAEVSSLPTGAGSNGKLP